MAGTIFGLGLSQQFGADRNPLAGAKLYVYEAGTSTPVTTYEEFALTNSLPFPLEADSSGRIPSFWVADGSYRVRLTDVDGVEVFDENSITAIGASSGSGGGSSGVSDEQIFQTGDPIWVPRSGTRTGWVRLNGRTIGSSSSGASERANADCETLFLHLWNNYTDSIAPVTGGRGASAAADWAANKVIEPPDMRGRGSFGLDDMGNGAADIIAGATIPGASGGSATASFTIALENIPSYTLSYALFVSTSIQNGSNVVTDVDLNKVNDGAASGGTNYLRSTTSLNLTKKDLELDNNAVSGTISSGGSGDPLVGSLLNPLRVGTWYMKL